MINPSFSLQDKVAIVTGGGTGIGRSIALVLAEAGADVVIASRRLAVLEAAAQEIRALGRRSLAIQADISKKADIENLAQKTMDEFGGVDILVNNAATGMTRQGILQYSENEWDFVMDTNLKSCYLCCQAVFKMMVERKKGNIINVSSNDGLSTFGGDSRPYNIAKAGVIMLTRCLAWELGPYNIRVNAIAPGVTKTEMSQEVWSNPESVKNVQATRPLARLGEPSDIASVALFLASDASGYITGETIVVDGGRMA